MLGNKVSGTDIPISNSDFDDIFLDFDTQGNGVQQVRDTHEGLHSNKSSSSNDLSTNERNSTLGVSDLPILSTSSPSSSSRVGDLIDLSSTGITHPNRTGIAPVPHPPTTSTGSAVSDNVFDNRSDTEDIVNRKEEASGADDVFRAEKEKESIKEGADLSKGEKAKDRSPTYDQMLAEQRRKTEELRQKGQHVALTCRLRIHLDIVSSCACLWSLKSHVWTFLYYFL